MADKKKSSNNPPVAAKPPPKPEAPIEANEIEAGVRQLTDCRKRFRALDATVAAMLLALHSAEACRERGTATRAAATFRDALFWARTFAESPNDPVVAEAADRIRWFLDCMTALGTLLLPNGGPVGTPSEVSAIVDARVTLERQIARVHRRLVNVAGTNADARALVGAAMDVPQDADATLYRAGKLAKLLDEWLSPDAKVQRPLASFGLTAATVSGLRDGATVLADLIAVKRAPRQNDRDTPDVNEAEGRLYYVMRPLWDDFAEAREEGRTALQLRITPTLARGLDLPSRKTRREPAAPTS